LAWSLWAATIAMLLGLGALAAVTGIPADEVVFAIVLPFLVLASSTVGALVGSRHPGNPIGWIFLCVALLLGLAPLGTGVADYAAAQDLAVSGVVRAADWLGAWVFLPGIYLPVTFLFLLFPDGHLPSRRWLPVALVSAAGILAISAATALAPGRLEEAVILRSNPFAIGSSDLWGVVSAVSYPLGFAGLLGSVAALVVRFRRSFGEERQQMKWLVSASLVVAALFMLAGVLFGLAQESEGLTIFSQVVTLIAVMLIPLAAGIAILKYRLYDIDVVISKTLVYGGLVTFITVVYVAIVVGIGTLVGTRDEPNLGLSIAATAVVAVAFQPVRERVRHLANRLVYGKRATPYEVMADFSHRMAGTISIEDALPQMAEAAARGVGAVRSRVRLFIPTGTEHSVDWPPDQPGDGFARAIDVYHQGEPVGEIAVAKPPEEPLTPAESKLLEDLASQAGLALHNVRLAVELRARLDEITAQSEALRLSRQRIVTARDVQRRQLEREIREGAQQQLMEIGVKLRAATDLVERDAAEALALLDELGADANETLAELRDLARGIFPPLLADKGVVAALEAHVRKEGIPAALDVDAARDLRFDPEAEAAVFFCCVQALQNAKRHAGGVGISLHLVATDGTIDFTVSDEGAGFDPTSASEGMGFQIMRDRVEALDGTLDVQSAPGAGTTVTGRIPARALEPAP
ncbi:MAG: ATP-binding protein, partial [Actinomycetota bacterium]